MLTILKIIRIKTYIAFALYLTNRLFRLIMAANLAALRQMLVRLGCTNPAAQYITDVGRGGMDTIEAFESLTDEQVEDLVKSVRRPGGTIANPNANVAGQPPEITNPGIPISLKAQVNIQLLCKHLRYKTNVGRTVGADPASITLEIVRRLEDYKKWEKTHEDPEAPTIEFNKTSWPRIMDTITEYLRDCLGSTKIPLAYIVRDDVDVPDEAEDPDIWTADSKYSTIQDELVRRAPHKDGNGVYLQHYRDDNVKVYTLIAALTREKECWSYIKNAIGRNRDGRGAYMALKNHYLGPHMVDNEANKAETILATLNYSGETRRWNFERYVRKHVDQHAILDGLTEHGYSGIDDLSKVRHLLNGIKDDRLKHVIATIQASATLRKNFDACVNLFQTSIKQSPDAMTRHANISSVQRNGQHQSSGDKSAKWDSIDPDMSVELRYYKKSEYDKLPISKKKGLKIKRQRQKGSKRKSDDQSNQVMTKKAMIRQIKKLVRKHTSTDNADNADNDSSDDEGEQVTNRNNPALERR